MTLLIVQRLFQLCLLTLQFSYLSLQISILALHLSIITPSYIAVGVGIADLGVTHTSVMMFLNRSPYEHVL